MHSKLGPLPPLSSQPQTQAQTQTQPIPTAWSAAPNSNEEGTGEGTGIDYITEEQLLADSPPSSRSQVEDNERDWGDTLSGQVELLNKTLVGCDRGDIEDIANTAIPLASTLLEIGEKQNDAQKMLRSHQVLCEVAQMGVWSVGAEDEVK